VGTGSPCGGTLGAGIAAPGAGAVSASTGGAAMSGGGPVSPKF
jgi:hypothetical protein